MGGWNSCLWGMKRTDLDPDSKATPDSNTTRLHGAHIFSPSPPWEVLGPRKSFFLNTAKCKVWPSQVSVLQTVIHSVWTYIRVHHFPSIPMSCASHVKSCAMEGTWERRKLCSQKQLALLISHPPAPLEDGNSWTHLLTELLRKYFEIWHVLVLEGRKVSEMKGFEVQTKWVNDLIL